MEVRKSLLRNGRIETSVFKRAISEKNVRKDDATELKETDIDEMAKEIRGRIKKKKIERKKDKGSFEVKFKHPLSRKDSNSLRKKVQDRETGTDEKEGQDQDLEAPKKPSLASENKRDPIKMIFQGRREALYAEVVYS